MILQHFLKILLLVLLIQLDLRSASLADEEKHPPAKTPREAVEQLAKAAKARNHDSVRTYLGDRAAKLVENVVGMFRAEAEFEATLDNKFGKSANRTSAPLESLLEMYFSVRFIDSKETNNKTIVELERAIAMPDGKKDIARIKCFAVKEKDAWKIDYPLMMVAPRSIHKVPDTEGNLHYVQDFTDAKSWEEQLKLQERAFPLRRKLLEWLTRQTADGKFKSREEAKARQHQEEMRPKGPQIP
jgi:hypothetical protein